MIWYNWSLELKYWVNVEVTGELFFSDERFRVMIPLIMLDVSKTIYSSLLLSEPIQYACFLGSTAGIHVCDFGSPLRRVAGIDEEEDHTTDHKCLQLRTGYETRPDDSLFEGWQIPSTFFVHCSALQIYAHLQTLLWKFCCALSWVILAVHACRHVLPVDLASSL